MRAPAYRPCESPREIKTLEPQMSQISQMGTDSTRMSARKSARTPISILCASVKSVDPVLFLRHLRHLRFQFFLLSCL
jgi:hypothetical protein